MVIGWRYDHHLPTILCTNYLLPDLAERLGAPIMDRLVHKTLFMDLYGCPDLRFEATPRSVTTNDDKRMRQANGTIDMASKGD